MYQLTAEIDPHMEVDLTNDPLLLSMNVLPSELRGLQVSSNTGVIHSAQQGSPLDAYTLLIVANCCEENRGLKIHPRLSSQTHKKN